MFIRLLRGLLWVGYLKEVSSLNSMNSSMNLRLLKVLLRGKETFSWPSMLRRPS